MSIPDSDSANFSLFNRSGWCDRLLLNEGVPASSARAHSHTFYRFFFFYFFGQSLILHFLFSYLSIIYQFIYLFIHLFLSCHHKWCPLICSDDGGHVGCPDCFALDWILDPPSKGRRLAFSPHHFSLLSLSLSLFSSSLLSFLLHCLLLFMPSYTSLVDNPGTSFPVDVRYLYCVLRRPWRKRQRSSCRRPRSRAKT